MGNIDSKGNDYDEYGQVHSVQVQADGRRAVNLSSGHRGNYWRMPFLFLVFLIPVLLFVGMFYFRSHQPVLLAPKHESVHTDTPYFSWQEIEGSVGYNLQITNAEDNDFKNTAEYKIAKNTLTYSPQDLREGSYIWRVRATMPAGNYTDWSSANTFTLNIQNYAINDSSAPTVTKEDATIITKEDVNPVVTPRQNSVDATPPLVAPDQFDYNSEDYHVFTQDFEQTNLGLYTDSEAYDDFTKDGHNASWVYSAGDKPTIESIDGNQLLKKSFKQGSCCYDDHGFNVQMDLDKSYDELYLSYRLRVDEEFGPAKGGKMFGLCGGDCNVGGTKPTGYDGWSARNMWRSEGDIVQYVYHPGQPSIYGEDLSYGDNFRLSSNWQTIEHRVKINTPGQYDGVIEAWVDGRLALRRTDLQFRKTNKFAIDQLKINSFWGGNDQSWAPTRDESFYFDDIILSTKRIGI